LRRVCRRFGSTSMGLGGLQTCQSRIFRLNRSSRFFNFYADIEYLTAVAPQQAGKTGHYLTPLPHQTPLYTVEPNGIIGVNSYTLMNFCTSCLCNGAYADLQNCVK